MGNVIIIIFSAGILFGLIYQIVSMIIFKKEFEKSKSNKQNSNKNYPLVSILKPLKGIDDKLESNLESFFNLDYPEYEVIFGIQDVNDPAKEIVENLKNRYPNIKSKLVIDNFKIGLNPKINNMYNMYPLINGNYVLISDSNTQVESNFLNLLVNVFEEENTGLVTATIRGMGSKTMISLMENIHLNSFLSPSVFAAAKIANFSIVVGKAILIPKFLLDRIGGFESFKNYLAEDYLMGIKVEELGYKVKTAPVLVNNINEKWSLSKFLNRHTRWAKIRAKIRLKTYIIESISNPISASFILGILLFNEIGLLQFLFVSGIKSMVDYFSLRIIDSDIKWYQIFIIPIKDLIIGLIWYVPFFNSAVTWRNNSFKIKKDSLLQPILTDYNF